MVPEQNFDNHLEICKIEEIEEEEEKSVPFLVKKIEAEEEEKPYPSPIQEVTRTY